MKVLQLGKFYPVRGGVEKVMWDITDGLSAKGVWCDMLCADFDGTGERIVPLNDNGRCIVVPSQGMLASTMISPKMISWMRSRSNEYDIVHVHHPDPMACLALRLSGFKGKVVLHWHSDILRQKFFLKFYRPLQSWLIKRADRILCTSPVYAEESEPLRNSRNKISVLPIGIDRVQPDPEGEAGIRARYGDKKIVYSLGRLIGYKGYQYLVEAASYLSDEYVVVIGGDGPLREELESKIENLGLGGKVSLVGRVEDSDLAAWYGACDVFCLSSIWKTEAFAIVQVEAMSCGKPIVATRIPGSGVSWVNRDGFSGLNVEPRDAKALADAIMEICGEDYGKFSAGARERFAETFTKEIMIDNCLKIYETL